MENLTGQGFENIGTKVGGMAAKLGV